MAGSVTITTKSTPRYQLSQGPIVAVRMAWTSDASGDVSGTLTDFLSGLLLLATFCPDGTDTPTDLYDVVVDDEDGVDVLGAAGANLPGGASKDDVQKEPILSTGGTNVGPRPINSKLQLVVSNAGASKKGEVVLYILLNK